jgi:N-methylhydantoinase B
MVRGDRIEMNLPGGGGFGSPFARDPEAVLADVKLGFVSTQVAAARYGVAITADGQAVDAVETARLRAAQGSNEGEQA